MKDMGSLPAECFMETLEWMMETEIGEDAEGIAHKKCIKEALALYTNEDELLAEHVSTYRIQRAYGGRKKLVMTLGCGKDLIRATHWFWDKSGGKVRKGRPPMTGLEKVVLGANGRNWREKLVYGDELFTEKCLEFIERSAESDTPFFAYLALTSPHLGNSVPAPYRELYRENGWPHVKAKPGHYRNDDGQNEAYAGMITHMDTMVGRVREKLQALGIAENTLLIFTSDNGQEWGTDFFNHESPFRGKKRTLNEGGIRMPTFVWWPGTVEAGSQSDVPLAFWDFMPTFCELAGTKSPQQTDGISIVPLLTGEGELKQHEYLFWYFNERNGPIVAVRFGKWKALRSWNRKTKSLGGVSLWDLEADPKENNNLASKYPEIAQKALDYMEEAWVEGPNFPQTLMKKR